MEPKMPKLSKFFTVAVEGATVDGRNIDRQWILDMAATFNPDNYGVRMNMEHIRPVCGRPVQGLWRCPRGENGKIGRAHV